MPDIVLCDTTLRDGAGREGISFSVEDKLRIVAKLDELGVPYVEAGWPGANPKDADFFRRARELTLASARLVAFGATRRRDSHAADDPNLRAVVAAGVGAATIVGKSWDLHVTDVLETTLPENLAMIADSIAFLKAAGLTVLFDAEHYFDGYKDNPEYALEALRAAAQAGADTVVLCDTNGGALPDQVAAATAAARSAVAVPIGIHAHNDAELAVANSLAAVAAGATHVQGTINGYGERCGNANLCSVIPDLQLKMGRRCLSDSQLARLAEVARFVSEIANIAPDAHLPFVGASAFAHKAGLHIAALAKRRDSYEHIDPALVGNRQRTLVSELSGRASIVEKARRLGIALQEVDASRLADEIKVHESEGFAFDVAEASFELLLLRRQPEYRPPFQVVTFRVVVEPGYQAATAGKGSRLISAARLTLQVGDRSYRSEGTGVGPVDALQRALSKVLLRFYPSLAGLTLSDFKVHIIGGERGTEAVVRVLTEWNDGGRTWWTVGSSANIIEASLQAIVDGLEYSLLPEVGA